MMDTITLSAVIGEDHRLVIELPEDTPTGPVELTIRSVGPAPVAATPREAVRASLLAAGLLVKDMGIPDDLDPVSDEEIERLGEMQPGARPSEALVAEDRGH